MSGIDLNDFDDPAVIAAIQRKTERLRRALRDAQAEYVEWVEGLRAIGTLDSDVESDELKPSDDAASPPPSEPASSPTPPPSRRRAASTADKQRQVDIVVALAGELGPRVGLGAISRAATSLSTYQAKSAVGEAVRLGRLEVSGKGAGTRYTATESRAPVTQGPPPGRGPGPTSPETPPNGGNASQRQQPTLQGKILAGLQMGQKRIEDLIGELDAPEGTIRAAVGRLVREGELRIGKEHGETVYGLAA